MQLLGGTSGDQADQRVPRAHRVELGRSGRHDHFLGVDVEHAVGGTDDDRRPGVDRDRLHPVTGVEDDGASSLLPGDCRGRGPALAGTDHDDLRVAALDPDAPSRGRVRHVDLRCAMHRWSLHRRMALDHEPRAGGCLAGSDVRDAVDLGHAVATVASQADRATVMRMLAGAHHRDGD